MGRSSIVMLIGKDTAPFKIRRALPRDRDRLRQIFLTGRQTAFPWIDPTRFRLEDYDRAVEDEEVWVAIDDHGDLIGFAAIYLPGSFLHSLYIDPSHQRSGIGRALIDIVLRRIIPPLRLKCIVINHPARAFYEALGFVQEKGREGMGEHGPYIVYRYG